MCTWTVVSKQPIPPASPNPPVPLKDKTKSNFLYIETFLLETVSPCTPKLCPSQRQHKISFPLHWNVFIRNHIPLHPQTVPPKDKTIFLYIDIQSRSIIYMYNTYNTNRTLILYQSQGYVEKYVDFHSEIYM